MDSHVPALYRTVLVTGEGTSSELDSPGSMDLSHCNHLLQFHRGTLHFLHPPLLLSALRGQRPTASWAFSCAEGLAVSVHRVGSREWPRMALGLICSGVPRLRDVAAFQLQLASPCGCTWQRVEQDTAQLFSALRSSQ